jgi:hypothetical protein
MFLMINSHFRSNGKKQSNNNNNDSNPFDDHDEEWDDNSENVLTDNGIIMQ